MSKKLHCLNKEALHFFLQYSKLLQEFLDQLPKSIPIKDITIAIFEPNNKYLAFSTKKTLVEYFLKEIPDNGYFKNILQQISPSAPLWIQWSSEINHKDIIKYKELDICNGCVFYVRKGEKILGIQFTTGKETSFLTASNFYINNKTFIEKISHRFLQRIEQQLLVNDHLPRAEFIESVNINYKGINVLAYSHDDILMRTYFIEEKEILLTVQENRCLELLSRGKSKKEIANILDIGLGTVDSYLNKIKIKMDHYHKNQLIDIYEKNVKN